MFLTLCRYHLPEVKYPRSPGYKPSREEDPLAAWSRKVVIEGARDGAFAGQRVAIKDCIAVAGVPMSACEVF